MRSIVLLAALLGASATAQTTPPAASITLFELPGYLGRSVTITDGTADLAGQLRARSARVTGSWQLCPQASYAGTCRTVASNQPLINPVALSARPSAAASTATNAPAAGGAAVDLSALDAGGGTDGQDVTFYARPTLSGSEVAAGSSDLAAAGAFCKLAGGSAAVAATRARAPASNLVDATAAVRVRGYALRDVVCRR